MQDPNLARQVRDLFEALCARTCTDSTFDTDTVRLLLSPALSPLSQSYLAEHRAKLLANNPNYPSLALMSALSDLVNFSTETTRSALAAFPNETTRGRAAGAVLQQICAAVGGPQNPSDAAGKLLTAYARLQKLDLCAGLFHLQSGVQLSAEVVGRIEQTYRTIFSWQLPATELPEAQRGVVMDAMAMATQWGTRIGASLLTLKNLLFLMPTDAIGPFSTLPCSDAILDAVSGAGAMSSDRLTLLLALMMRSAKSGVLKVSLAFGPVFVERVMMSESTADDKWTAALIVALAAVLCPQAVGTPALAFPSVRKLIMMLVTRRFVASPEVPTTVLAPLQSIPSLVALASKSRDPDFVVMTMQADPDAMQTAPLWLPQLLATGDASFLNGLPADAALKTLLVATKGGANSPLSPHVSLLASKIDLGHGVAVSLLIESLLHVSSTERAAAVMALALCQGEFAPAESLRLLLGTLEVETDWKRMATVLRRCAFPVVSKETGLAVMKILQRRPGLRRCLVSSAELQMVLLKVAVASGVEGDALLVLLPPADSKALAPDAGALLKQVKRSAMATVVASVQDLTVKLSEFAVAKQEPTQDPSWWISVPPKAVRAPVKKAKKQEVADGIHQVVALPASVDWSSHPGVVMDQKPDARRRVSVIAFGGHESGYHRPAKKNIPRNAVLCLMNNSPVARLANLILLRYAPDAATSTALLQFASVARPINMDAVLVACKEASTESLDAILDTLLSVPQASVSEKRVRQFFELILASPRLSAWAQTQQSSLRKLLATRGGVSWDEAEARVSRVGFQTVAVDYDARVSRAVQALQSEDVAERQEAYDTVVSMVGSASEAVQELVLCEWRFATHSQNLQIVKDAVDAGAGLHIVLGGKAGVREWLAKSHGPRSTADSMRAMLVANGYASF